MTIGEEIRASATAHRDLGPAYDTAVAEGLVERIGEEIDRRVDARLRAHLVPPAVAPGPPVRQPRPANPGRIGFGAVAIALGSMGMAIGATATVLHPGDDGHIGGAGALVAFIWIVIGVINVAYARRR